MLDFYDRLFTYDHWANQQSLRSLQRFPTSPAKPLRIMAHIVAVEWLWMARLRGEPNTIVWPDWDLDRCHAEAEKLPGAWARYVRELDDDGLSRPVAYVNSKGERFTNTVADILTHVIIHGGYHRGQIAGEVRAAGGTPAYTDFIEGVRRGMQRP